MRRTILGFILSASAFALGSVADAQTAPDDDLLGGERYSLIYSPEVPLGGSTLGQAIGRAANGGGIHNLGLEISSKTGFVARYHAQLDYTYAGGLSGVRLEPLGFGWAVPLVRTESVGFEIEPLLSLADGLLLFTDDSSGNSNVTFLLGAGAEVQANLILGPFYLFASPLGIELRYLEVTSGAGQQVTAGAAVYYRFRVGLGVRYW
ncbi:MAG: hypothetical protein ACYDCL_18960 [Myxococcales bacterium]